MEQLILLADFIYLFQFLPYGNNNSIAQFAFLSVIIFNYIKNCVYSSYIQISIYVWGYMSMHAVCMDENNRESDDNVVDIFTLMV